MVTKHVIAGALIIGIASTLMLFTEPPNPPEGSCPECQKHGGGMTQPQDEEKEKLLKELDPERLERLKHLREVDPPMNMKLEETQRERMELRELKERDPQRYEQVIQERKMETEIKGLAMQCRKSQDNDEKENLKKQIKTRLEKLFDLREAQREIEIKRLEEELTKLKEKMKVRKANRDKIIDRRQKELIGEEDDMGW